MPIRQQRMHTSFICTALWKLFSNFQNYIVLQNLTDYRPIPCDKTLWSSKIFVLKRFDKIRDELVEASESLDADLPIENGACFASTVRRYMRMLQVITIVAYSLHTRGHRFAVCRDDLDWLIDSVCTEGRKRNLELYQCRNLYKSYLTWLTSSPDPKLHCSNHKAAGRQG